MSMPIGWARVRTTSMTWGWQSASTKKQSGPLRVMRRAMAIASAAAVPSHSSDELAISMPTRSHTIVW